MSEKHIKENLEAREAHDLRCSIWSEKSRVAVAMVYGGTESIHGDAKANADRFCRAWNVLEDAVKMAEMIEAASTPFGGGSATVMPTSDEWEAIVAKAREILAKVKP